MKGIYLGAFRALHEGHDIIYQDINGKRDLGGDMLDVDLSPYDYIIATPPCNYYSRANYRREVSEYSQKTKHLLPAILDKLVRQDKPFIVENVLNSSLIPHDWDEYFFKWNGHSYWSNIKVPVEDLTEIYEYKENLCREKRQGGAKVHAVVEAFINEVEKNEIKTSR